MFSLTAKWIFLFGSLAIFFTNGIVLMGALPDSSLGGHADFAIVLGASVHGQVLSDVLKARVSAAVHLYQMGQVNCILMSGDGSKAHYNETAAMKKYALKDGIPENALFTDAKGFNTYTSMLRAKEVFHVKQAYIVTQNFHLGRAVWIARKVGIRAQGQNAGSVDREWYYQIREFFARFKDFVSIGFQEVS